MTLAAAAMDLARQGFAVFPLQPKAKKPLAFSTGLHAACVDPDVAHKRWAGIVTLPANASAGARIVKAGPQSNVAIATGHVSKVWVLDIDGMTGEAALCALETVHGALPHTVESITGKGRQLLFAWDARRPVRNMSKRSRERIGDEIDVRGDGGYIVAPPSIHPSGRTYAWAFGRAPGEIELAAAPDWLLELVTAPDEVAPAAPVQPRPPRDGRASRYGEAVLATAEREISGAAPGSQNDTLWRKSILVGCFVSGSEIERGYARDVLLRAGLSMSAAKGAWTHDLVSKTIDRAFEWAENHPREAPARDQPVAPAAQPKRERETPASEAAQTLTLSRRLWHEARGGWVRIAGDWLRARGLEPAGLPDALAKHLRVHPDPWGSGGRQGRGPALIAPLVSDPFELDPEISSLLLQPVAHGVQASQRCVGDHVGRVAVLHRPNTPEGVLVALTLADGWALGQAALEESWQLLVVVAPRLASFAGWALGDRYGRVDPDTPHADPERPPWLLRDCAWPVQLAARRDLKSPPLKVRKALGGTVEIRLEGDGAARFYGGLAEQQWRAAGANAVRVIRPTRGMGFAAEGTR